jgi:endonuclease/exonuclease/phosphatase family metal-dependent hydrolase
MRWRIAVLLAAAALAPLTPIFALAQGEVTVMTYNIRVGLGLKGSWTGHDPTENLAAIADVIRDSGTDIVLLQEVDRGVERTGGIDEAALLAQHLAMDHRHAPALQHQGGEYGVALLTTWEIRDHEIRRLFRPDHTETHPELPDYFSEQRVAQIARLASGEANLTVVNTHLGLTREQRLPQLAEIAQILDQCLADGPVLFGGDLNCEPDAPELLPVRALLRDCYHGFTDQRRLLRDVPIAERLTFPSDAPVRCIDYLFVSDRDVEVLETAVIDTTASDHRPVVTRITLEPAENPPQP